MVHYVMLALLVLGDAILPAIPSEITTVTAGAFAASGRLDLMLVWLAVFTGAVAGDLMVHGMGRLLGARALRLFARRPASAAVVARAERLLGRRAVVKLVAARFVPGGRTMGALVTGSLRYPFRRFVGVSVLGAMAWSTWMVGIGYFAGGMVGQPVVASVVAVGVMFLVSGIPLLRRWIAARSGVDHRLGPVAGSLTMAA